MGLDASDVTLVSGAMAASPLFCRGCRELQLSFCRIGEDARPSHHAATLRAGTCNQWCWRLQLALCTQPALSYTPQATWAARSSPRH
jgi:hypothetical protein